jgi:FAD/FMN-containing dehydrogenase
MAPNRRDFLKLGAAAALTALPRSRASADASVGVALNDIHSQLNRTVVDRVVSVTSVDDVRAAIRAARAGKKSVSVAGGRHAMGGQQFGAGAVHVDMTGLNRVLAFDQERGIVDAEAGIQWPQLIGHLESAQVGKPEQWGIVQKQTGADRLSLGGALAANVHGRGLSFKPIVDQVESFTLMDHTGEVRRCSRTENAELFRLAIGGYGMFGVVTSVRLRLWRRRKVRRVVERREIKDIPAAFEQRIADGYLYGDFQYATDAKHDSFLRRGVFSCYQPVPADTPVTENPKRFRPEDWARLTYYAHKYKRRAFQVYSDRYVETSGQIYWSDSQLSAAYLDDYHHEVDRKLRAKVKGTEMITEIYVPRASLVDFMEAARVDLRGRNANVIYGTIRLIERDDESFLAWAKDRYACVIFNLHIDHTPEKIADAERAFRALIDLGIRFGGSYYLTYHRFATRQQVETCYPQFREFLRLKREHDPGELFQSEWYRHYRGMFAG